MEVIASLQGILATVFGDEGMFSKSAKAMKRDANKIKRGNVEMMRAE
jgi:hypothetical protein